MASQLAAPRCIGAYEILHELKVGGMGAVLLARRRGPGTFEQLVAIKTIRPEYASAQAVRAMFLDEAAILARLTHPGIATVHDFGEEAGTLYMVMEYVAGIPFRELQDLRPPATIAARAVADAARGLHAAHELRDLGGNLLGIVHRDISPDNLMLGYDGHVKVIDFGIALVKNRQAPVTEFGTVKGKPPYMSPEQLKNAALDRRSDVFSLGVVLHELLVNQPLFDGDSIYAIARAVEHLAIPLPSRVLGEALPLGLDAAVMNALDRDLQRRTPSAAAFAASLEDVLQGGGGGESLQAWAEHGLAEPRAAHRSWLASVVAGIDLARPIGRPTGTVTAVGPEFGQTLPAAPALADTPPVPPDVAAREPATHLAAAPADDDLAHVPQRRSRTPLVLAGLVLGALGAGSVAVWRSGSTSQEAGIADDASRLPATLLDASAVVARRDLPADAAAPVIVSVVGVADARPAEPRRVLDAGGRTVEPRRTPDAGGRTVPRDALTPRVAPVLVDAAPRPVAAAALEGIGFLNVFHRANGSYVTVMIDGKSAGPTPISRRKLATGPHTIQLLAADTSAVVFEHTVTIEDGKTATVREP